MAKTFATSQKDIPDNATDIGTQITNWLNGLEIPSGNTVYEINIDHVHGFWVCICIYEP